MRVNCILVVVGDLFEGDEESVLYSREDRMESGREIAEGCLVLNTF